MKIVPISSSSSSETFKYPKPEPLYQKHHSALPMCWDGFQGYWFRCSYTNVISHIFTSTTLLIFDRHSQTRRDLSLSLSVFIAALRRELWKMSAKLHQEVFLEFAGRSRRLSQIRHVHGFYLKRSEIYCFRSVLGNTPSFNWSRLAVIVTDGLILPSGFCPESNISFAEAVVVVLSRNFIQMVGPRTTAAWQNQD